MAAFYQRRPVDPARRLIPPGLATSCTPPLIPACSLPRSTSFSARLGTETVSLVQIFRVHDGKIVLMRDYFAPGIVD
jgi:hypothetical protein